MPLTTPNKGASVQDLSSFIEETIGDADLRVDQELGHGFVKLKVSETDKRQAAQDIRSSEDVVIELLRNARDAGAHSIFIATHREDDIRTIVCIDDGCGIPLEMRDRIFEPRVTSKLDSAHMDRWGMHGRGMALYSLRVNAEEASVSDSEPGKGSSFLTALNLRHLTEKKDQSTFPRVEMAEGSLAMRGPKNIVRTTTEFALEHARDLEIYLGSMTEIAATLYQYGMTTLLPTVRAFGENSADAKLIQRLAFSIDPNDFCERAARLGLILSSRSARRIMDGSIASIPSLKDRVKSESFTSPHHKASKKRRSTDQPKRSYRISSKDLRELCNEIAIAFSDIAERYYLCDDVEITARISDDALKINIPLAERSSDR